MHIDVLIFLTYLFIKWFERTYEITIEFGLTHWLDSALYYPGGVGVGLGAFVGVGGSYFTNTY